MRIRCIDASGFYPRSERPLVVGRIYEIDPRRDIATSTLFDHRITLYWIDGVSYAAGRFVQED